MLYFGYGVIMNKKHFKKILKKIKKYPESWNQRSYHCGTAHCIAGHAQIEMGKPPLDRDARSDAREYLDLSFAEADYIFAIPRTIEDFDKFLKTGNFYDKSNYDDAGYDIDGFDVNNKRIKV